MRLTAVSRRWGSATALDSISLHVRPGSFTVLLGPSGCGKTTCLRIVAGLETASEGRVEIGGRDVTKPAAGRARRRHGVPILRSVPASDGCRKYRVRTEGAARADGRTRAPAGSRGGHSRHRCIAATQAVAVVRRAAATRGAGPRHRRRSAGLPDGRAAVEPGCTASCRHAARNPGAATAAWHHHAVCHARSDRGHGHGRPDRAAA